MNTSKGKEKRKQPNPYPLRLPEELSETVKSLAGEAHRSVNAQIIVMLEEYLKMIAEGEKNR